MKTFFCSLILLFTAMLACAQSNINYISFFPPAHVIHNEVSLTQDDNSFTYGDGNIGGYAAKKGGLILAAADNSATIIDTLTVRENNTFAVNNFNVDNIIRVNSSGTVQNISIGNPNDCTGTACSTAYISANAIYFPTKTIWNSVTMNIYSSGVTKATGKIAGHGQNSSPGEFIPMTGITSLKWVNLRINGTEECRRYLVANQPGAANNCNI